MHFDNQYFCVDVMQQKTQSVDIGSIKGIEIGTFDF